MTYMRQVCNPDFIIHFSYKMAEMSCSHFSPFIVRQSILKPQLLVIAKTKELSEDLRATIVTANKDGVGYTAIAKQFHVPIPTVQSIVKKYKTFHTVSTLKGRGRKLKVDPRLARKLVIQVADNPRITSKELLDQTIESGVQLSMKTLKRILNKACLHGCRPRTNPLHMPRHLQSHLAFAKKHLDKEEANLEMSWHVQGVCPWPAPTETSLIECPL